MENLDLFVLLKFFHALVVTLAYQWCYRSMMGLQPLKIY